jgi:hypothetical protein
VRARTWSERGASLRRTVLVALLTFGLGGACGPVAPAPPPPEPVNACPPDSCVAYQQPTGLPAATCNTNGQCAASDIPSDFDFTMIVSIPEAPFTADPGVTIAIPQFLSTYILQSGNQCQVPSCPGCPCAVIPSSVQAQGSFVASGTLQVCLGRDPKPPSLPVEVQFWPFWSAGAKSTVQVAAESIGLPLLPRAGRALASGLVSPGPGGSSGTEWFALVSPNVNYEQDLIPLDTAYPPQILPPGPISSTFQLPQAGFGPDSDECPPTLPVVPAPPLVTTFPVTRGNGSLAGFSVYLRSVATSRRVSSLSTLLDATSASVTLLTTGGEWPPALGALDLVIAPPADTPIPTYADPIQTSQLTATAYPALPTPMTVTGTVFDAEQHPIDADLVINSTTPQGDTGGIYACSDPSCPINSIISGNVERVLSYSTTAHATAGSYSVVLPPGAYSVFIVPGAGVVAGATSVPLVVQPAIPGYTPIAAGKSLYATEPGTIRGVAQLSDGRALVDAIVEAHASTSLAAMNPPVPQQLWPRTMTAVTDVNGAFSMSVDPGIYDVVVRPLDGTGFPWMTAASQSVGAGTALSLTPFVVPAPIFIDMTLEDQGRPLVGAIVRTFTAAPGPLPDSGAPPPQVELGSWLTDANGHFSMFVAPPQ